MTQYLAINRCDGQYPEKDHEQNGYEHCYTIYRLLVGTPTLENTVCISL